MHVIWDPKKARTNLQKHKVDLADAAVALEDINALTILDPAHHNEYRFKTLALSPSANVLLIIHAEEVEDTIRIISAREADPTQRKQYYEGDFHE